MSDMPNSVAPAESGEEKKSLNFVEQIVEGDLRAGKNDGDAWLVWSVLCK